MSLLTMAQTVAREVGFEPPAFICGNNDATARQILAIANREGKILSRRHNWAALQKEFYIVTIANQSNYDMPTDFDRLVEDTVWNRSASQKLIGPSKARLWQERKSGNAHSGSGYGFRIKNDGNGNLKFALDPNPGSSGEEIVFEYQSQNWCKNDINGNSQPEWLSDQDISLLPEDLMTCGICWRFLFSKGLEYAAMFAEYENLIAQYAARDGGMNCFSSDQSVSLIGVSNYPDRNFGM